MLKVRLMGTKNDIKWFRKILQTNPKIEVTEFSDLYQNKGTKKYHRAYVEVRKSSVKEKENIIMCKIIAIVNQKGGVGKTTKTREESAAD